MMAKLPRPAGQRAAQHASQRVVVRYIHTLLAAALLSGTTAGCHLGLGGLRTRAAGIQGSTVADPPAPNQIVASIFLVGDAGETGGVLVLRAIGASMRTLAPDKSVVVFLGDNIYPAGLPDPADRKAYDEKSAILREQLGAIPAPQRAVLVPGNHDWGDQQHGDPATIRRQGVLVRSIDSTRFAVLPADGCPGPVSFDVGTRFRLFAIDTQWWLHHRSETTAHCTAQTPEDVAQQLSAGLTAANQDGRDAIIAAHHPLASGGWHGMGKLDQDVGGLRYQRMIEHLHTVFRAQPPLVYAAGHDHSLQVLRERTVPHLLVSGAGVEEKLTPTRTLPNTVYALYGYPGYMRLDAVADGRVLLRVYTLSRGDAPVFSQWLSATKSPRMTSPTGGGETRE
jgi:hypothetical protein